MFADWCVYIWKERENEIEHIIIHHGGVRNLLGLTSLKVYHPDEDRHKIVSSAKYNSSRKNCQACPSVHPYDPSSKSL
jgi:hypothetical protein